MTTLTAAQIAAILEPLATTTFVDIGLEVNAALMQNEERRKYPSVDVQNITGQEDIKDFPTKTTGQTFLVHLFYRYRSFGAQEEPEIKEIEDAIFDLIDDDTSFDVPDTKVTVTQSWDRKSETFPVHRSHSILTVTAEDISSTDDAGLSGNEMEITFPAPLSKTFTLISLATDERNLIKQQNLTDSSEEIFTKIHAAGLLAVEIELTFTEETNLQTLVDAGDDISVTLSKNGSNRVLTVNLTSMVSSATRSTIQSTIVTMDVKN